MSFSEPASPKQLGSLAAVQYGSCRIPTVLPHFCLLVRQVYSGYLTRALKGFNPYMTNGFSHYYHLGEFTFIYRGIRSDFQYSNKFLMKIPLANRIAPDGTPRSAASHLGLFCLPMSQKRGTRLK